MANPFRWEHLIYLFAGLAIGALLGYFVGIFVFALLVSSATYNANATQASFFIIRYSQIPMAVTLIGMLLGAAFGFVYSHEKYEKEEKASQPQVIIVPQGQAPQQQQK
jgi:H+/Cl- antiporter ClcA